jgi:hypothetical protein
MNKLEEMWAALLAYLPQAIAAGHGDSWAKMCNEKTAAYAAYAASDDAAYAGKAAYAAAWAADAWDASDADYWAQKGIDRITKITEKKHE